MTKTKTIETVEEYDEHGRLTRKAVTETEMTDDSPVQYAHISQPYLPFATVTPGASDKK